MNVCRSKGRAFVSVKDSDKIGAIEVGRSLIDLGFKLVATRGTARELLNAGLKCEQVDKVNEGRPDVSDMLKNEQIDLIINTTEADSPLQTQQSYGVWHFSIRSAIRPR